MSGIYINGLEMPKKDGALCIVIHHDGKVCHFFDLQCEQIATAFPVPPHGRGIDADVLMGVIREHDYLLRAHFNSTDNGMFTIGIQQAVDEVPTLIPADQVKEEER